jgi:hypothetical protein
MRVFKPPEWFRQGFRGTIRAFKHDKTFPYGLTAMPGSLDELQSKVDRLERELAELRAKVNGRSDRWWVDHAGRFAHDSEFRKIVRLGRAYRQSLGKKAGS